MLDCDHDTETDLETPTDSDLLAEAGLTPKAIREVLSGRNGVGESAGPARSQSIVIIET